MEDVNLESDAPPIGCGDLQRVDHSSNRRCLTTARVIEVQHTLDRTRLQSINKRTGVSIKRTVSGLGTVGGGKGSIEVNKEIRCLGTFTVWMNGADRLARIGGGGNLSGSRRIEQTSGRHRSRFLLS